MVDRRADLALSLTITLVGVFVLFTAQDIRLGAINDPLGPRGMPTFLGAFMVVGGAALVITRLARWRGESGNQVASDGRDDDAPGTPASFRRTLLVIAASAGYAAVLEPLGFLVATALLMMILLYVMEISLWPAAVAGGIGCAVACYLLFAVVLTVRLPAGVLEPVLRSLNLPA